MKMKNQNHCLITSAARRSNWMRWISPFILISIFLAGCSSGVVAPPDIVDTWKPPEGSVVIQPESCEEIGSLFAYDTRAPLNIQETSRIREGGVTIIDLTYTSPMGGLVPATLVVPDGKGPFAGILYQHGMPSTREPLIPAAVSYARMGAVVILIDAPFNRPEHVGTELLTFTEQDRREQIQLIIDLRRAIDLLLSRQDVDPQRLAYIGISYGGAMGGLLAGVENRLKAYVLQLGDGGLVTHVSGPEDKESWLAIPEEVRQQWVAWMWPIEPIHYVACANPANLLFQNGTLDKMVPPADALRYQKAGSAPKTILWYETGHGLRVDAAQDQAAWLGRIIGIANQQPIPRNIELILIAWFFMTAGCLVIIARDLWRMQSVPQGARFMWLLTTVFMGLLGLIIYWISIDQPRNKGKSPVQQSPSRRALGSAAWASAGNMVGGIGVVALLLYLPNVFGANLILQIAATFLLPFYGGWLVFAVSRWVSRFDTDYPLIYYRSIILEVVSTSCVLTGVYPMVNIINDLWLSRWTYPFGYDLTYLPLWGALCIAVFAGTLTAYPIHVWMLQRGVIRWGTGNLHEAGHLAWYVQVVLVALSFAVMLGAIYLSLQFA